MAHLRWSIRLARMTSVPTQLLGYMSPSFCQHWQCARLCTWQWTKDSLRPHEAQALEERDKKWATIMPCEMCYSEQYSARDSHRALGQGGPLDKESPKLQLSVWVGVCQWAVFLPEERGPCLPLSWYLHWGLPLCGSGVCSTFLIPSLSGTQSTSNPLPGPSRTYIWCCVVPVISGAFLAASLFFPSGLFPLLWLGLLLS